MLSVWAILPAQVSLPSLVEVVGLLHNWIRSPSRPLNEDHLYTSLFASPYKFEGPGLHFGAWFGSNFGPCFGFHFWAPFWAPTITNKIKGPKAGPKNGTRNKDQNWTQIRTPKCNPGPQICTETQTRSTWSSFSGLLGDRIQLCNKLTTSTKEGRETWAGKIAQTESMNTFTDQT